MWKFVKQKVLFTKALNWVQHLVSVLILVYCVVINFNWLIIFFTDSKRRESKSGIKDKDKERERSKEREKEKERDGERSRDKDKENDKERDRRKQV